MTENDITYSIIGGIYNVYNGLGPGLLESIYEAALVHELKKRGLKVEKQVPLKIVYDDIVLPMDYRIDLLLEDTVIIELKSVEVISEVHHKQILTYMKIANKPLGLLVNFNTSNIAKSIFRKIL